MVISGPGIKPKFAAVSRVTRVLTKVQGLSVPTYYHYIISINNNEIL